MNSTSTETPNNSQEQTETIEKRIVHKAGGRHLMFRIKRGRFWFVPKPYALISNIEGSIWVFYGIGQVWLTHRKIRQINEWWVRVPRIFATKVEFLTDRLEAEISEFIDAIRQQDLIGTIILERRVIEFHWTVPRNRRLEKREHQKLESIVDLRFNKLALAFAKLQLAGIEGVEDTPVEKIKLEQTMD